MGMRKNYKDKFSAIQSFFFPMPPPPEMYFYSPLPSIFFYIWLRGILPIVHGYDDLNADHDGNVVE